MHKIRITVNGKDHEISRDATLNDFLDGRNLAKDRIIVSVNGNVIQPENYSNTTLRAEDRLELMTFVGGG